MNTPTPTPRTDAAWNATFDSEQISAGQTARTLREHSQQLETELAALTAERDQLRFYNSTLRAEQKACEACDEPTAFEVRQLRARAERAEAEVERLNALNSWAHTCTHHNDQQRAACPVCLVTALTTERDKLRAEVEKVYALVTPVGFDLPGGIFETAQAVSELLARAKRAEDELATEREKSERYRLATLRLDAELAAERARLDYLLQWDVTFHDRADIDAELSYGQRKKSTPTLP